MFKFSHAATLSAGILAASVLVSPALARDSSEARIAAVRYSDLDLSHERGQRTLERRIESAAREVCGVNDRLTGSMIPSGEARACYLRARENIDREIAARTGHQVYRG